MQTIWGDLGVADAHVHFFSQRFFSSLAALKCASLSSVARMLEWELPEENPESLAERWVAELDHHRVERAALIASIPEDESSVAAAIARFPERFYGYFMLNPCVGDPAARTSAALTAGLRGICLFPAMQRYSIQDPRLEPVFELAQSTPGTIVFVHCGVLSVGVRKKLGLPSPFDMRFSNPIDLHFVALRNPKLTFVVPHFGAGYFREALMLGDLCPNVLLDTSSTNGWMRYQLPAVDLESVFRRALEVLGPRRLLFGSDSSFFPRGWNAQIFRTQSETLAKLGISESDAHLIFGDNLKRILQ